MGKLTQGINMINIKDTITVLERGDDGFLIRSIMLIKKEKAEDYANYWEQENNESSQTIEELINGTKTIEDILNKIFKG